MSFDTKKFIKEKFTPRVKEVPVPDMGAFFPAGEKPVWIVRGLHGQELGRANEAVEKNKNMSAVIEAIAGGSSKEKTEALKSMIGLSAGQTPSDIVKRIEHLVMGSVDPVCTQEMAVKVCEVWPVVFFQLTNTILELSGQGQMPGKQKASGELNQSGPASPSDTPEEGSSTN